MNHLKKLWIWDHSKKNYNKAKKPIQLVNDNYKKYFVTAKEGYYCRYIKLNAIIF